MRRTGESSHPRGQLRRLRDRALGVEFGGDVGSADHVNRDARGLERFDEVARDILAAGKRRPLLLATRYTMEHGFYANRMKDAGLDVMVPDEAGRALIHSVIFDELCQGKVLDTSRERVLALIEAARAAGADSVILGCTEICLLLDPDALSLPGFDSTAIHARAAVDFALGPVVASKAA